MEEEKSDGFKPSHRPKYQSEFSMGQYDFARYDKTLINIDQLSGFVNSTDIPPLELMQKFLAELVNLHDDFKPLIGTAKLQKEYYDLINELVKLKRRWEQSRRSGIPFSKKMVFRFVDLCRKLKTKLYETKQYIGLGIVVRRNMSASERIKKGVRSPTTFDNLPEA